MKNTCNKLICAVLFFGLASCSSQKKVQYEENVAVGGVGTVKNPTTADEMLRMQEKEEERQEKELEDIKRQEYYDYKHREYLRGK